MGEFRRLTERDWRVTYQLLVTCMVARFCLKLLDAKRLGGRDYPSRSKRNVSALASATWRVRRALRLR